MTPNLTPYLFNKDVLPDVPSGRPYELRTYVVETALGARALAITGQGMVACAADAADVKPHGAELELGKINEWLTRDGHSAEVTLDVLAERLGPPDAALPQPTRSQEGCDRCWGDGQHECDCGDAHDCAACDGTGFRTVMETGKQPLRVVTVGGITLNAALVRRYLPLLTSTIVAIRWVEDDKQPVRFECGATTLLIMPLMFGTKADSRTTLVEAEPASHQGESPSA